MAPSTTVPRGPDNTTRLTPRAGLEDKAEDGEWEVGQE